jgi:hypothetical protein
MATKDKQNIEFTQITQSTVAFMTIPFQINQNSTLDLHFAILQFLQHAVQNGYNIHQHVLKLSNV